MPPIDFESLAKSAFDQIKNTLGIQATYTPKVGAPKTITGPFDDRALQVDPDTEVVVASNVYTFGVKLDDLDLPPVKGDQLTIKGNTYYVIEVQEDGVPDASAVLILHKKGTPL